MFYYNRKKISFPLVIMAKKISFKKTHIKNNFQKIYSLVRILFFISLAGATGFLCLFVWYARDLPRPEKFTERQIFQSTKIYDQTGEVLLYEIYGEEKREIISLDIIPEHLKEAVIAVEDANFYSHFGIDLKAILRALLADLKLGKPVQGGSTIPQQLIRSTFLTNEKTLKRKIREIILTLELSRRYSKNQILEWYFNQIPFGSNSYGIEAASRIFFSKSCKDLDLVEAATLAALIRAPSLLSPYGENKEELLARKDYVLTRMVEEGFINQETAEENKKIEIKFSKKQQLIKAPHFVMEVQKYLIQKYGEEFLKKRGLKVYTSLDWDLQEMAEIIVKEGAELNKNYRAYNASLVAINPNSGQVLAMVGSKDYWADSYPEGCLSGKNCLFDPDFNIVTLGKRQPGSAFKPFVYVTAFEKGYSDKTIVIDEETNFGIWGGKVYIPQNYDGQFRGPVTLRQALAQSLNVPSVKVLVNLAGIKDSIETAKDLGITTLDKPLSFYGPSLVLGGGEVKLLDIVSAYGVFATQGLKVSPTTILKIEDSQGNIIEKTKKTQKRVLGKQTASLVNDILSDNKTRAPMFGSRSWLYFEDHQVSAKTGTTQDYRDGWTIGYTPKIVVGVWVGNNDNSPMYKKPGVTVAGPIWHQFMEKVLLKLES